MIIVFSTMRKDMEIKRKSYRIPGSLLIVCLVVGFILIATFPVGVAFVHQQKVHAQKVDVARWNRPSSPLSPEFVERLRVQSKYNRCKHGGSHVPHRSVLSMSSDAVPPSSSSPQQKEEHNDDSSSSVESSTESPPLFESIGQGVARDYNLRLPFYKSDITDGFNIQCLAAIMFLFFACLAPAVGFGALYGIATGNAIGTVEMISSTAACGILYALGSAQPMTIIGSTGPVLAFVATLAHLASKLGLPFLPLYSWTGLWTALILFVSSITSFSNSVKYLTRFTDETFSVLISFIFVFEACTDIARTFSVTTFPKALLSFICAATTFTLATSLKKLRQSMFFNKSIRNTVSDFAPTIGVIAASLIARWARITQGAELAALPCLSMPNTFATSSGRPWLIPLFELPVWARWAAALPALMASVLLFLDQNITVRLVNNPRYKMVKGLPWLVAATVRSLSHVGACQKYDEEGNQQGTIEQRVTGLSIHFLIGCCVLFRKPRQLLSNLPLPALMGLFLFLGTTGLQGNQMWERITGFFKDKNIAPKDPWTDKVPSSVTNLFTVIQIACLAAMLWVKESRYGVLFPVVIAMLSPIRFGLERSGLIKKEYMKVLDTDD